MTKVPNVSRELQLLAPEVARIVNCMTVDLDAGLSDLGIDFSNLPELVSACRHIYHADLHVNDLRLDAFTSLHDLDRQLKAACVRRARLRLAGSQRVKTETAGR